MPASLKIDNRTARWLWLDTQGLSETPTGALDLYAIILKLGMVQLDTIQYVARAHHHILWSRNQNYREPMLNPLLAKDRLIFEHFTHDASVIPMAFLPAWKRQFREMSKTARRWHGELENNPILEEIKNRIRTEGALSTHAFDTKIEGERKMWSRPPHKKALDFMWMRGELTTCYRDGFTKFYNLPERVFPADLHQQTLSETDELNTLLNAAVDRIAIGTQGEIQRFWETTSAKETKVWLETAKLVPVEVTNTDGTTTQCFGAPDIEERLAKLDAPTSRLRILNPFDPAVRDRNRLERLFGFNYRNEMFVPAAKRVWGYYVFPILEGDRLVGRIEVKAERKRGVLSVIDIWPEPGVKWGKSRWSKLDGELERLGRFVDCATVNWTKPKPR